MPDAAESVRPGGCQARSSRTRKCGQWLLSGACFIPAKCYHTCMEPTWVRRARHWSERDLAGLPPLGIRALCWHAGDRFGRQLKDGGHARLLPRPASPTRPTAIRSQGRFNPVANTSPTQESPYLPLNQPPYLKQADLPEALISILTPGSTVLLLNQTQPLAQLMQQNHRQR